MEFRGTHPPATGPPLTTDALTPTSYCPSCCPGGGPAPAARFTNNRTSFLCLLVICNLIGYVHTESILCIQSVYVAHIVFQWQTQSLPCKEGPNTPYAADMLGVAAGGCIAGVAGISAVEAALVAALLERLTPLVEAAGPLVVAGAARRNPPILRDVAQLTRSSKQG